MNALPNPIDPAAMSRREIEDYARAAVARSGDPEADPQPLIDALLNAAARERGLEDPYWRGLANVESHRIIWEGQ